MGQGGLYISCGAAATVKNLRKVDVSAVLRLGSRIDAYGELPNTYFVQSIVVNDDKHADISQHIDVMNSFIEMHLTAARNVLVHCGAGISRSGAAIVAYLMFSNRLRFQEAFSMARKAREYIAPNEAFKVQLKQYEGRLDSSGHYGQSDA